MGGDLRNHIDPVTDFLNRVQNGKDEDAKKKNDDSSSDDSDKKNASDSMIVSCIKVAAEMFEPSTVDELVDMVMEHLEDTDGNGDLKGGMPSRSKVKSMAQQQWDRLKKKYGLGNSDKKNDMCSDDSDKKNDEVEEEKENASVKKGDKVCVVKGQFQGDEGKVTLIDQDGVSIETADGGEVNVAPGDVKKI